MAIDTGGSCWNFWLHEQLLILPVVVHLRIRTANLYGCTSSVPSSVPETQCNVS